MRRRRQAGNSVVMRWKVIKMRDCCRRRMSGRPNPRSRKTLPAACMISFSSNCPHSSAAIRSCRWAVTRSASPRTGDGTPMAACSSSGARSFPPCQAGEPLSRSIGVQHPPRHAEDHDARLVFVLGRAEIALKRTLEHAVPPVSASTQQIKAGFSSPLQESAAPPNGVEEQNVRHKMGLRGSLKSAGFLDQRV
jgi:hypothetical protein